MGGASFGDGFRAPGCSLILVSLNFCVAIAILQFGDFDDLLPRLISVILIDESR